MDSAGLEEDCALSGDYLTSSKVTDDAFLGGEIMALQPRSGYRAGLDAVLLAASVSNGEGQPQRILDLGAGVGVVGLCVARRLLRVHVMLLEREPVLTALAVENIKRNDLSDRVEVQRDDLRAPAEILGLEANSFDQVCANPPFYSEDACRLPQDPLRAAAHAMAGGSLDQWLRVMARLTRAGGVARIIYRADALGELLAAFGRRFGGLSVLPIHSRDGEAALRVIVSGKKGSRGPMRILPGLVLHGPEKSFRPDVHRILRESCALEET